MCGFGFPDDKRIPADGRFLAQLHRSQCWWVNWQPMVVADTDRCLGIQALAIVGRVETSSRTRRFRKPLIDWIYGPFVLFLGELSSRNRRVGRAYRGNLEYLVDLHHRASTLN